MNRLAGVRATGYDARREVLASDQRCLPYNLKKCLHHGRTRCVRPAAPACACLREVHGDTCKEKGVANPPTHKRKLFVRTKCWRSRTTPKQTTSAWDIYISNRRNSFVRLLYRKGRNRKRYNFKSLKARVNHSSAQNIAGKSLHIQ